MTSLDQSLLSDGWRATPDAMMAELSPEHLIPPEHLQLLGYLFYLAARGYMPRLGISLPPGSAKSTLARWASAWVLDYKPRTKVIYASYGQRLAEVAGKDVRQILQDNEGRLTVRLRHGSKAADRWATTKDGGFLSGGVGSGITGFRGNFTIIDDPHKDWAEATSEYFTANIFAWYKSVIMTRMTPRTPLAIIATRWSVHDLIARIQEEQGPCKHCPKGNYHKCMQWCFVKLPAIAEQDETIETVLGEHTVTRLRALRVPLPVWSRAEGQPLWPELYDAEMDVWVPHYDLDEMEQKRIDVGPIVWEGLYQQRPPAEGGQYFDATKWRYCEMPPLEGLTMLRWWDTAATEEKTTGKKKADPDWTVGALLGRAPNGLTYVLDVVRWRSEPLESERKMRLVATNDMLDWKNIRQGINQDPAAAGKSYCDYLKRTVFNGFAVESDLESGSKLQRALPFAAQQAAGNVYLVTGPGALTIREGEYLPIGQKAPWIDAFVKEMSAFPDGAHDDQTDSASQAFSRLAGVGRTRVKLLN